MVDCMPNLQYQYNWLVKFGNRPTKIFWYRISQGREAEDVFVIVVDVVVDDSLSFDVFHLLKYYFDSFMVFESRINPPIFQLITLF